MSSSLRGFSNPLSPRGTAALVDAPPHHISADAVRVLFRAGDDVARSYLPDGLEPVEDGLGFAFVADMLKVSAEHPDQAFAAPRRTQYGEGIVGFYCRHGETAGRFSAFIWVDQDWSLAFGLMMGWGKKLGEIWRTHINPYNPAMGPVGPGTRLAGEVTRLGRPVLRVGVEIERAIEAGEMPAYGNRGFLLRHLPGVGPDIAEIRQLVSLGLSDVRTGEVFVGVPHLEISGIENEDLAPLRDVELVAGYAFKQGWTTNADLAVLRDYTAEGLVVAHA